MQVILLERVPNLGFILDTVDVKPGYARNYLIPRGLAVYANEANMKKYEHQRAVIETRNIERHSDATRVLEKLRDVSIVVIRQASEAGQLYGSVTAKDVTNALAGQQISVMPSQVEIRPIKVLGIHEIPINLHAEVRASIAVNVARSEEEAKQQWKRTVEEKIAAAEAQRKAQERALAAQERAQAAAQKSAEADGTAPTKVGDSRARSNADSPKRERNPARRTIAGAR